MKKNLLTLATAVSVLFLASCSDDDDNNNTVTLNDNGYEYVDLGLPSGLLWATTNIGATEVYDYGDYFAWGEITTKTEFNGSTYEFFDNETSSYTKYNKTDELTTLELEDDAARQIWGGDWRLPTTEEISELIDNATWTWTDNYENTNVSGYIVSGNNNSIFLPAAGIYQDATLNNVGKEGHYLSSSLESVISNYTESILCTSSGSIHVYHLYRHRGLSIRPVISSSSSN